MSAELLLYAVVAAGLVVWLRNILGTRHDGDVQRPNSFAETPESQAPDSMMGVKTATPFLAGEQADDDITAGLDRTMSIENDRALAGLKDIIRVDKQFLLPGFLRSAQDAFAMIVEGFADGDKELLRDLLSPSVYQAFEKVIDQRVRDGDKPSVEIHAIRKAEILAARMEGRIAFITVRFTADETSIIRNKDGVVTLGDPERVTETIDIWTFGRDVRSASPVWMVYETREAEDDELKGSTVPEAE